MRQYENIQREGERERETPSKMSNIKTDKKR